MPGKLSVVIPVYQGEGCLPTLYDRLIDVLSGLGPDFEIILVEDRGKDRSWEIIEDLSRKDRHVCGLRLSRNFGQHAAITAGLAESSGDWAVVMDCDLQDPPEEIPRLFAKLQEGCDVVYARRRRQGLSAYRRLASAAYFKLLNVLNETAIDGECGSFSLISRKVIDAYLRFLDRERHYLLILRWLGFESASIEYDQDPGLRGQSSYTLGALTKHALGGVFFQSNKFLTWIVYFGFFVAVSGLALATYIFGQYFFRSIFPGWTSLAVLILVMGGIGILCIGVTGLYIGKIFEQVRGRPLYVVDRKTALL